MILFVFRALRELNENELVQFIQSNPRADMAPVFELNDCRDARRCVAV